MSFMDSFKNLFYACYFRNKSLRIIKKLKLYSSVPLKLSCLWISYFTNLCFFMRITWLIVGLEQYLMGWKQFVILFLFLLESMIKVCGVVNILHVNVVFGTHRQRQLVWIIIGRQGWAWWQKKIVCMKKCCLRWITESKEEMWFLVREKCWVRHLEDGCEYVQAVYIFNLK